MNWLKQWWQSEAKLAAQAERLASDCLDRVWQAVEGRITGMSAAETRGYVRARAGLLVKHAVAAAVGPLPAQAKIAPRLGELTTEHLLRMVSARLRTTRPAQTTRRAA